MALYIVLAIIAALILWVVGVYNGLVRGKIRTEEAWSDIDVQLKRRYDLIPNLVETIKGYAKHEKQVFESVTEARTSAMHAKGPESKREAENMLTGTLKSLFAVAESYPDLKASDNFKELQGELSDTENKIEAARRFYNGNVRDYNIALDSFPTNFLANMFKFTKKALFEAGGDERELPKVSFDDKEVTEEKK
jgi:LemA protein